MPGPGSRLDDRLRAALAQRQATGLRRSLRTLPTAGKYLTLDGRRLLNLAGNDYLGLSGHPDLADAAIRAVRDLGVGATASRLVSGHLAVHEQAERDFACFKHAEAALLFPTGYTANLAVISGLVRDRRDLVLQDRLNHASLLDAARRCPATVRTYAHLDPAKARRLLQRHRDQYPQAQRFLVTDTIFSMDGDVADLPQLCAICEATDTVLIVDEAHATGVLGATGAGLVEHQGVTGRVPVVVSTASKALGGLGGIVTGSQALIDYLINFARPLIYSTAVPPAQAAVLSAAVARVRADAATRSRLREVCCRVRVALRDAGWRLDDSAVPTPIVPLQVGDSRAALTLQRRLEDAGLLTVAIRPPTVPPGTARVRLSLRADLDDAEVDRLLTAIGHPPSLVVHENGVVAPTAARAASSDGGGSR